jgi:hypothetical protein
MKGDPMYHTLVTSKSEIWHVECLTGFRVKGLPQEFKRTVLSPFSFTILPFDKVALAFIFL